MEQQRSQGRRRGLYPHWSEKYAKYHVFSAFDADFCSKNENNPQMGLAIRSCEGFAAHWYRKVEFFSSGPHLKLVRKTDWIWVKTFFFGNHPLSAGKTVQFWWRPFFWSPDFAEKPPQSDSRLIKILIKSIYCCFQLPKKPPPPLRIPAYAPALENAGLQPSPNFMFSVIGIATKILKKKFTFTYNFD